MNRIIAFLPGSVNAEALSREPEILRTVPVQAPLTAASTLRSLVEPAREAPFVLLYTRHTDLSLVHFALERMLQVADDAGKAVQNGLCLRVFVCLHGNFLRIQKKARRNFKMTDIYFI